MYRHTVLQIAAWFVHVWVACECGQCILQVLVGNKCDMDESKRAVPYSKGQALADELGIQFFETSAKSNTNVTEVGTGAAAAAALRLDAPCILFASAELPWRNSWQLSGLCLKG